jgi:hypothetical protein
VSVTTIIREDGSRLSYGPSVGVEGDNAGQVNGFDWTRYSADNEIEAQDWAETQAEIDAVVTAFHGGRRMT